MFLDYPSSFWLNPHVYPIKQAIVGEIHFKSPTSPRLGGSPKNSPMCSSAWEWCSSASPSNLLQSSRVTQQIWGFHQWWCFGAHSRYQNWDHFFQNDRAVDRTITVDITDFEQIKPDKTHQQCGQNNPSKTPGIMEIASWLVHGDGPASLWGWRGTSRRWIWGLPSCGQIYIWSKEV